MRAVSFKAFSSGDFRSEEHSGPWRATWVRGQLVGLEAWLPQPDGSQRYLHIVNAYREPRPPGRLARLLRRRR